MCTIRLVCGEENRRHVGITHAGQNWGLTEFLVFYFLGADGVSSLYLVKNKIDLKYDYNLIALVVTPPKYNVANFTTNKQELASSN